VFWFERPALDIIPELLMLLPPHLGHRFGEVSVGFAEGEGLEKLLCLPLRRGWYR